MMSPLYLCVVVLSLLSGTGAVLTDLKCDAVSRRVGESVMLNCTIEREAGSDSDDFKLMNVFCRTKFSEDVFHCNETSNCNLQGGVRCCIQQKWNSNSQNLSLIINAVKKLHDGNYNCTVNSDQGNKRGNGYLSIDDPDTTSTPPSVMQQPQGPQGPPEDPDTLPRLTSARIGILMAVFVLAAAVTLKKVFNHWRCMICRSAPYTDQKTNSYSPGHQLQEPG